MTLHVDVPGKNTNSGVTSHLMRYSLNSEHREYNDEIRRAFFYASIYAREQFPQELKELDKRSLFLRYFSTKDVSVNLHMIAVERIMPIDITPYTMSVCNKSEAETFVDLRDAIYYGEEGSNVLVVEDIIACEDNYGVCYESDRCFNEIGECNTGYTCPDLLSEIEGIAKINSQNMILALVPDPKVILHEFGHCCGFEHNNEPYNIMVVGTASNVQLCYDISGIALVGEDLIQAYQYGNKLWKTIDSVYEYQYKPF